MTLLTVTEVAAKLRVSKRTAYRLIDGGELAHVQINGRKVVHSDDLDQFIRSRRHPSNSEVLQKAASYLYQTA